MQAVTAGCSPVQPHPHQHVMQTTACVAVGPSAAGTDVMELQEFYEYMEQHRANAVDAAVQRYRSLTPVLGKVSSRDRAAVTAREVVVGRLPPCHSRHPSRQPCSHLTPQVEELVAGSNTGKAPQLCDYYSYWEMAVFNALVLMVLKGLEKLHSMLNKKPLFKASQALLK